MITPAIYKSYSDNSKVSGFEVNIRKVVTILLITANNY